MLLPTFGRLADRPTKVKGGARVSLPGHLAVYCMPPIWRIIPFSSIIVSTALTVEAGRPLRFVSSSMC